MGYSPLIQHLAVKSLVFSDKEAKGSSIETVSGGLVGVKNIKVVGAKCPPRGNLVRADFLSKILKMRGHSMCWTAMLPVIW